MSIADSLTLPCGLVLPNRLAKAAMSEGAADSLNQPTPELATLYRRWSEGGAGLLITGNCQVDRRFMERPGNTALDGPQSEEALAQWRAFAAAAKAAGSAAIVQLGHAGRQSDKRVNKHLVGPSAIPTVDMNPEAPKDSTIRALTVEEVQECVQRFVAAAKVCQASGFDGIQIHGAHGYLLSSFLNPLANTRDDEYGGDLANRARLLLAVVDAIREATGPTFAISVKLNSKDFQTGGFTPEECATVAGWLEQHGVDLLEVSGGTYEKPAMLVSRRDSTKRREGFFLEFTKLVRSTVTTMPLMVTGGFRSRAFMEQCLANKDCEVIGIGRPLCILPDGPKQLLEGKLEALQDYDAAVPWYMWPLYWTSIGPALETMMNLAWYCRSIVEFGAGKSVADPVRPFLDMLWLRSHDNAQAAALQGLDCVGSILNAQRQ